MQGSVLAKSVFVFFCVVVCSCLFSFNFINSGQVKYAGADSANVRFWFWYIDFLLNNLLQFYRDQKSSMHCNLKNINRQNTSKKKSSLKNETWKSLFIHLPTNIKHTRQGYVQYQWYMMTLLWTKCWCHLLISGNAKHAKKFFGFFLFSCHDGTSQLLPCFR